MNTPERTKQLQKIKQYKKANLSEKNRVLQKIEAIRKERNLKFHKIEQQHDTTIPNKQTTITSSNQNHDTAISSSKCIQHTEAILQIRLPSGETIRHIFSSNSKISDVIKFIAQSQEMDENNFTLLQPFPRKEYTDDTVHMTLVEAELVPRGMLTVIKSESRGVVKKAEEQQYYSSYNNNNHSYYRSQYNENNNNEDYNDDQDDDDEEDIDYMTYEELLELEERIGNVHTGATQEQIEALPVITYTDNVKKSCEDTTCLICQMEFEFNEEVRGLFCDHFYHKNCIDTWLSTKRTCPKCLRRIDSISA